MNSIKTNSADVYFSLCVRERALFTCQYCGKYYQEGNRQGLHCSHLFSRRHYSIRYDPSNAFAHCFGCHNHLGGNPVIFSQWALGVLGSDEIERLTALRLDTYTAKLIKKNIKDVAKFFKSEHEKMVKMREQGYKDLTFGRYILVI